MKKTKKTAHVLVPREVYEELKEENAKTMVPMVYIMQKAWDAYKRECKKEV